MQDYRIGATKRSANEKTSAKRAISLRLLDAEDVIER